MAKRKVNGQQAAVGASCGCGGACLACQARPAVMTALSAGAHDQQPADDATAAERLAYAALALVEAGHATIDNEAENPVIVFAEDIDKDLEQLAVSAAEELADGDDEEKAEALLAAFGTAARYTHASFEGSHTHSHPSYGQQGEDATHEHEHAHAGDSNHSHEHSITAAADPTEETAPVEDAFASTRLSAAATGSIMAAGLCPTPWGYLPSSDAVERARMRDAVKQEFVALVQQGRLTAAAGDGTATDVEAEWHAYLFVEGVRTTDHRAVAMGAMTWRDLPLPLEWARAYEGGHYGKVVVGSIETVEKVDGPMGIVLWYSTGLWDLGGEDGAECARQVALQGGTRWVSADVEVIRSHTESSGGGEIDIMDIIFGDADDDDWYDVLDEGRGMGATVVSTPAFPQCVIAPRSVQLELVEPTQQTPDIVPGLVAAAATASPTARATKAFFDDPGFKLGDARLVEVKDRTGKTFRGCPVNFEEPDADGNRRVFGHVALWGFCHTGFANECVLAPHSASGYAYFRTGEYRTGEGDRVPVGQLTIGTKHADGYLRHNETARHYDHTGTAVADVACGEDEFGIWIAGVARGDITEDQLRAARASSPSGDWRLVGGSMELVAVLDVNVPGFPVPRSIAASLVAAGAPETYDVHATVHYEGWGEERRPVSLIAAGRVPRHPMAEFVASMRQEMAALRSDVAALAPLRAEWEAQEAERAARTVEELAARIAV